MTTLFALLLGTCGLSHREAAELLRVRLDTVKSWASGRRQVPDQALAELAVLAVRIDRAADEGLAQLVGSGARAVELGAASDDVEARALGWPCAGAQHASLAAMAAWAIAQGVAVRLVPRGSTPATAAAADAHERSQASRSD